MSTFKVAAASLIVGLLIGFVPVYWKSLEVERQVRQDAERVEMELVRKERQLRVSLLQGQLGTLLIDVQRQNFGEASARSTAFFDALSEGIEAVQDDQTKASLTAVSRYRDSVTSGIAKADPETPKILQQMYLDLAAASAVQ